MNERLAICMFILQHYAPAREWNKEFLLKWVDWYLARCLIGVARAQGCIVGLGLVRALNRPEDWRNRYLHVENGPVMFVDLSISQHDSAYMALWHCALNRLGRREWVAHGRYHRGQMKIWKLPFDQFTKKLLGDSYVQPQSSLASATARCA